MQAKKKKKGKKFSFVQEYKYGITIPCTVSKALDHDQQAGNTKWQDAMSKEINALTKLKCFKFKPNGYNPGA